MRNLLVLGPKTIPLRVRWPLGTNAGMLACCHFLALAQAMVLPSVAQGFLSRPPSAYRFEPGDRLVYELRSESTPLTPGAAGERCFGQIEIWCLALKNGEALLLLDFIRIVDNRAEPMRGVVVRIDSRGRATMTSAMQEQAIEMESAWEVLPVQASAVESGSSWSAPAGLFGRRRHCRAEDDAEQPGTTRVEFVTAYPPGAGEVLGHSCEGKYWFDRAAGCVTRFENIEIDKPANRRTESAGVLRSRSSMPPGWAQRRAAEAEQYELAVRRESSLLRQIQDRPETVEEAMRSLDRLWAGLAAELARQESPFRTLARAKRQRWTAEADQVRQMANYAQRWLGRTAVPWTLPDARAQMVSSESVRRHACLELLWRTDEPRSLAELAQLQAARDELGDSEIPVICLNLDQDTSAARRSIAQLPAGPTHILAGPIAAVEQPVNLPILRVLDGDGKIVRVWIGWQPSCVEAFVEARRCGQ